MHHQAKVNKAQGRLATEPGTEAFSKYLAFLSDLHAEHFANLTLVKAVIDASPHAIR